ncbi:MAG TPA: acyl-CoA thioester hydrolase/BAAT C-terminal domain-containing protein [Acidimicrobiales bacterium]|nr:acyl-CoA thioester hydrolase/BAAT C-terminal domain-containing protein [Acidimicrobiales bacterium]
MSNPRPTDVPAALIPVGRIRGRVMLVCRGHDRRWASCAYAGTIASELTAAGRRPPVLLGYPDAGHGVGFALPYLPELDTPGLEGTGPSANPLARADEWPRSWLSWGRAGEMPGPLGPRRRRPRRGRSVPDRMRGRPPDQP